MITIRDNHSKGHDLDVWYFVDVHLSANVRVVVAVTIHRDQSDYRVPTFIRGV